MRQNLCAGCLESLDLHQWSLVLHLAQEVPCLFVYLAADPSVCVGQLLFVLLLVFHAEVGTSCPVVQPSYPGQPGVAVLSPDASISSQLAFLKLGLFGLREGEYGIGCRTHITLGQAEMA